MADDSRPLRALVVGSSAGIGREVGLYLARQGVTVAFHGRRAELLEAAVAEAGSGCFVVADLAKSDDCERLIAEAVAGVGGQLDLVIHAASASRLGLVRDLDRDDWLSLLTANVVAPALVFRAAVPHLSERAVYAMVSSESVGNPYHGLVPYVASKAALEEIVRGLRLEHPDVRFSCVRVGQTMPTDFARDFDPVLVAELFPKWAAHAKLSARSMDTGELGGLIASYLAAAVVAPSVEVQDLVLRSPQGEMMTDASGAIAGVTGG